MDNRNERHGLISVTDLRLLLATAKVALMSYASSVLGGEEFDGTCVIDSAKWKRTGGRNSVQSNVTYVSRSGDITVTWHPKTAVVPAHFTVDKA